MNADSLQSIEDLQLFLSGTQPIVFVVSSNKDECYQWIRKTLVGFRYLMLGRRDKGVVIRYILRITGYSRQQLTLLIRQYRETGLIIRQQRTVNGFSRRYTGADIRLLAKMDELHNTPNGIAIKKLCERAYLVFNDSAFCRLASISVSHIYNLRQTQGYLRQRYTVTKTQATKVAIGERKKPNPNGMPGYIRIDTVHQGDLDKRKGVYHINAVDEVTQMEMVATIEKISERYLIPALEQLIESFPFKLRGFHSDNGSEYINKDVAKLLNKLNIEMTKSRSRKSNDNALAEGKNAHIVRKMYGHSHIPKPWAALMNQFNQHYLNPYINYHRPCLFAESITDEKGKIRKRYPYQLASTPYEKLKTIDNAENYLKQGLTFEILDHIAYKISDNQAADELKKASQILFKTMNLSNSTTVNS